LGRPVRKPAQYLMLARYYGGELRRLTTPDPSRQGVDISSPITWNRYVYARNNPIGRFDPDGQVDRSTMDMDRRAGYWDKVGTAPLGQGSTLGYDIVHGFVLGGLGIFVAPVAVLGAEEALPILYWQAANPANHLAAYKLLAAATDNPSSVPSVRGGIQPVLQGRAGEEAVKSVADIGPKLRIVVNGVERIPDGLNEARGVLTEVKNVSRMYLTSQIRDFIQYSQENALQFDLWVRESTILRPPVQECIEAGLINLMIIQGIP